MKWLLNVPNLGSVALFNSTKNEHCGDHHNKPSKIGMEISRSSKILGSYPYLCCGRRTMVGFRNLLLLDEILKRSVKLNREGKLTYEKLMMCTC